MHKKFEINRTKIKGGWQLGRKVVAHNSMSYLPLVTGKNTINQLFVAKSKKSLFIFFKLVIIIFFNPMIYFLKPPIFIPVFSHGRTYFIFVAKDAHTEYERKD